MDGSSRHATAAAPQPDLPAFVRSSEVRSDDKVAAAWLSRRLAQLGKARSWLDSGGTSIADKCSTAFNPGPPVYYIIYCNRSVTGYYSFSGDLARQKIRLERLLGRGGWTGFQPLRQAGGVSLGLSADASRFDAAAPHLPDRELVLEWGGRPTLAGADQELAALEPPPRWRSLPGVVKLQAVSARQIARLLARHSYLVAVRVTAAYFFVQARGEFPPPPA